jgi:hypothetical protein
VRDFDSDIVGNREFHLPGFSGDALIFLDIYALPNQDFPSHRFESDMGVAAR